ncbi:MAG: hypothetical protein HY893_03565 [Deltaproteobacteria bacterium]|nr:hypothetical protein [Deltaproteobacteria bacterium]
MSDLRIQHIEEMVGAGHPILSDTLNRLAIVEHNNDGTHKGAVNAQSSAYGLTVDGATDNYAGLQAAIDAANASSPNKTVHMPSGVYMLSQSLVLYSDMRLIGDGSGNGITIIRAHSSMVDGDYLVDTVDLSRVYIENILFQVLSSDGRYQKVNGLKAWGLNRWQMRNVFFTGFDIALDIRKGTSQEANNGLFDGLILQYSKTGAVVTGQDLRFVHPTIEQNKTGMLIGDIYASGDSHTKSVTLEHPHFETNSVGAWIGKCRGTAIRDAYAYYSNIHIDGSAYRTVIDGFDGYGCDVIDNGIRTSRRNYHSTRVAGATSPQLREFGSYDVDYSAGDNLWRSCVPRNPDFATNISTGWTATSATISIPDDTHEAVYGTGAMRLISTSGVGYVSCDVPDVVAGEDYLTRAVVTNLKSNGTSTTFGVYKGSDNSFIAGSPAVMPLIDPNVPNLPQDYRFVTTIPAGETAVKYRISTDDTDTSYGSIIFRADMVKSLLTNGSFGGTYTGGVPSGWEITAGATGAKDTTTYRVNQAWELTATAASARIRQTGVSVEAGQVYLVGGYIQTDSASGAFEVRWGESQYQRILRAIPSNAQWANAQTIGASTFIPFSALFRAHKTSDNILSLSASNLVSGEKFRVADFYMIPVTGEMDFSMQNRKRTISNASLTLSGAAQTVTLMKANANYTMRAARLIYTVATSADAGVTVSVGIRRNAANTNSYFTSVTSEISKAVGDVTEMTLTSMDIRKGDVIFGYTAGGKTGAGDCLVEIEYE